MKVINKYKRKTKFKNYHIIFSDIETIIENNIHKPIVVGLIDSNDNSYIFNSIDEYMKYIIENLTFIIIYFHNFGRFDSTFILQWVVNNKKLVGDIEVIERNNIIYQVKLVKFNIYFRDSYLLIPLSLDSIGKTFCSKYKKDSFNYSEITNIYYSSNREIINNLCINDCKVLKEGFQVFSNLIYEEFNIVLHEQLTLPSLSFNIFKHKYYNPDETPISKNIYNEDEFIRRSYVGGISEVFIPYLENGYCYDANSLYPFVMMNNKFPVGKGKFVKGEDININEFIGFIECEVSVDKEINFLTYRDSERGLITPTGKWVSVYYYKEILKALELGYKIKLIRGFKYEKEEFLFKSFVEEIYEIRKNSTSKSMNSIAKLILNSLYGRFGMKIFTQSTKFIKSQDIKNIKKDFNIKNIFYIGNDLYTVSVTKKSENKKDLYKNSVDTETAVQIASTVTSLARIFMYKFKTLEDNKCYYTDTDSIFLQKKLDSKYLGNELGEFKLEYEINEGFFIAPKVYYIIMKNSKEKIVIKGIKKEEYQNLDILTTFKKIISGKNSYFDIIRENNFKRNLYELITYIQKINIKFKFPFNKRVKLYQGKKWVTTRAIKIKKN